MTHQFRPCFRSFLESLTYDISPAVLVGVVLYFKGSHPGVLIGIASALTLVFVFAMILQTVFAHLIRLEVNPTGIRVIGPRSRVQSLQWEEIHEATLRERRNSVSRTDHLIILKSGRIMLTYPVSVLSPPDESAVLDELRRRTRLLVIQDRPVI